MRRLSIAYLLQSTDKPWGGVQTVFRQAEALVGMGHQVTLYTRTSTPDADSCAAEIVQVPDFDRRWLRPHDLVVGTFYPTVPPALLSGCGRPVHFCQGYEADAPRMTEDLPFIEAVYQLEGVAHITMAPTLARQLNQRFGLAAKAVPFGIDTKLYRAAPQSRAPGQTLRIALIGPWEIEWKGIEIGVRAARLAHQRGVDLQLVRVSPTKQHPDEPAAWGSTPVEWHEQLSQAEMPAVYRSCDIFLGTTRGGTESFFMPAMEAMSCGLPVVLSDVWCFHDYDHDTAFTTFIPVGDAEGFAEQIVKLAADPSRRQHWRERSLEVSRRHSFSRHAEAMQQALQDLVPPGQAQSEGYQFDPEIDLPSGLYRKTQLLQQLGQRANDPATPLDHASELWRTALSIAPQHAASWDGLARTELRRGNETASLLAIEGLERADPESLCGRRLRGLLHINAQRFAAAVTELQSAIDHGHLGTNIHLELSLAHLGCGDIAAGEACLARAQALQLFDSRSQLLLEQITKVLNQLVTLEPANC